MTTLIRNVKAFFHWLKNKLVQLNVFDSDRCRSDAFYLRTAIISTRIYIILIVLIGIILIVTSVLSDQTESKTIQQPSQAIYEDLLNKYPTTLSCRCRQTAIPFGTFISVSTQYHPICSSFFVSDDWIRLLFNPNIAYYFQLDFRSIASGHFQLLSSFCSLAKQTVQDALHDFLSSTLSSVNVLSPRSLHIQSQAQSTFVRRSSSDTVRRLVDLIRDTTHNNRLQPALQTTGLNTLYIYPDGELASGTTDACLVDINGTEHCCSFGYLSLPSGFYDLYTYGNSTLYVSLNAPIVNVTGFMGGCYALDSLLESTLECLFDQHCLNTLLRFFSTTNISAMNIIRMNQTRFSPKTLIGTLVNELFIEQWLTTNSFSAYYNQCAPIACTYTFAQRNNIVYRLTTLIGLYGGLTIILRACVLHIIQWWRSRANHSNRTHARMLLIERFQTACRQMKMKMIQLNLYRIDGTDTDPYHSRSAIISTRIYLLFLALAITNLIIFTSLQTQIQSITVENPTRQKFEELYNKYSTELKCPCSQIAVNYGSFISLSPRYHPVCSGPYISTAWIVSLLGTVNYNFFYNHYDFHIVGQTFFSTVSVLCSTAQSTFESAWFIFNHSTLITDHAISDGELMIRANSVLDQFESNTINEFKRLFSLIRLHTMTMFTTTRSNADLYTRQLINDNIQKGERIDFQSQSMRYDGCICTLTDECQLQVPMYSNGNNDFYDKKFLLPNFFVGCFTIQSVLESSLECFFNQTCLDAVQTEIISDKSINISILQTNATQFPPETLIGTLMNSLMIEDWNRKIQYDQYYDQCAPKLCSYTTFNRKTAIYILTKLIGLIGGLTISLKIVVFLIVKGIRQRMRPTTEVGPRIARPILKDRIRASWFGFKIMVLQLNIFTRKLTIDVHRRYVGIIATRLYFFFIILSITILVIYTSIEMHTRRITESKPSQMKFERLQLNSRYVSTLECPCRHISIPYGTFISAVPQFHQLCLSDFATQSFQWMNLTYSHRAAIRLNYSFDDFRIFIVPEFQSLFSLCTLANETLTDALTLFMSNTFTNTHVQTRETIEKHANDSLVRFRSSIPRTFVRMLDYVRQIAQGNGIVSSILSNWHFLSLNTTQQGDSLWAEPRSYNEGNCSCGTNATCTSPAFIDGWRVPGFLVGCYPLEALLQSTLECLYNVECINKLKFMYYTMNITIRPLDPLLSNPNVTVQSLVNELLIVGWETNVIYERYYAACKPLFCSYSISERANVAVIISTIVGLFGGLSVVLKLIIPTLVIIIQHIIMHRRRRRIQPHLSVIEIPD